MIVGGMQDYELRVMRLLDHAERESSTREIVTRWADGSQTRTHWAGIARDARRLASALVKLGLQPGDRVATRRIQQHTGVHHAVWVQGLSGAGEGLAEQRRHLLSTLH